MLALLFWLLVGHALADYPLQGDFLARAKNHRNPLPGVPWVYGLLPHALIHAGAVTFLTGSPTLGALELVAHALIDYGKCAGAFGSSGDYAAPGRVEWDGHAADRRAFHLDQALHVACKLAWVLLAPVIGAPGLPPILSRIVP